MRTSRFLFSVLFLVILGYAVPAYAPPKCDGVNDPPACNKNPGGPGSDTQEFLFEPRNGPNGTGLSTRIDEASKFDFTVRAALCPGQPEVWWPRFAASQKKGAATYTADGADLIIDIITDVQWVRDHPDSEGRTSGAFNGCFNGDGKMVLLCRTVGRGKQRTYQAHLTWDFAFYRDSQLTEYFRMVSANWSYTGYGDDPEDPDFVDCSKDGASVRINTPFDFYRIVEDANSGTSTQYEVQLGVQMEFNFARHTL